MQGVLRVTVTVVGLVLVASASGSALALTVRAVSPAVGLHFTDLQPVDVRVEVSGASSQATVDYTVHETEGAWHSSGQLILSNLTTGRGQAPLPLQLPGRGLYKLALSAHSGTATAATETWIAVTFTPFPVDPLSPWGIFYIPPSWTGLSNPQAVLAAAHSHRLLGASWSRLNFWPFSYGTVNVANGQVAADWSLWKHYARALREEGIFIMGGVSQMVRALSSQPNDESTDLHGGPLWSRVKPADYRLWDQLIEKLAADFREEIQVWEIWNEPDIPGVFWAGTVDEFMELIQHTSQALRRGNPNARVAASGFVKDAAYTERLFQLGLASYIDILSVHYTDESGDVSRWRNLVSKYSPALPLWNTEEKSEVPLRNLANGVERSFKFLHIAFAPLYDEYRPLLRTDFTVLPAGIHYSVGAYCIGRGRAAGSSSLATGLNAYFFQSGHELVGVFERPRGGSGQFVNPALPTVTLAVKPVLPGSAPVVTDAWGRSAPLSVVNGQAQLTLSSAFTFVNGASQVHVLQLSWLPSSTQAPGPAQKQPVIINESP